MTESIYFADFIKQHRAELFNVCDLSSFADDLERFLDEIVIDYLIDDYEKWVDELLREGACEITVSRQEIREAIAVMAEGEKRIIDLTRLFIQELQTHDCLYGRSAGADRWETTPKNIKRANMLMGYAIGVAYEDTQSIRLVARKGVNRKTSKLSIDKVSLVVGTALSLFSIWQNMQPNQQLSELIELQKQENALIQEANDKREEQMDQISDLLIELPEVLEEDYRALNAQIEAIQECMEALEQSLEIDDKKAEHSVSKECEPTDPLPECDCGCHEN